MKSIINSFKKYATFSGRASRREYWLFVLFYCIVTVFAMLPRVPMLIGKLIMRMPSIETGFAILNSLGMIALLALVASIIPLIAVTIRRLHDIGRSGFWYFIRCVPFIGELWFLILTVRAGTPNRNEWGINPLIAPSPEDTTTIEGNTTP